MTRPPSRSIGDLTFPEVSQHLRDSSILLLPVGAIEQHGPHLPLNTDVVIAEELTRRIIDRWGDALDLWQLPTISISLSREHDWAPGTLCLTLENFIAIIRDLTREIVRSLPARNLVIINGHGGNRGVWKISFAISRTTPRSMPASSILSISGARKAPLLMSTAERARPR